MHLTARSCFITRPESENAQHALVGETTRLRWSWMPSWKCQQVPCGSMQSLYLCCSRYRAESSMLNHYSCLDDVACGWHKLQQEVDLGINPQLQVAGVSALLPWLNTKINSLLVKDLYKYKANLLMCITFLCHH